MATTIEAPQMGAITLAQVAHFDNFGKTGKGSPRHMLRACLWTTPAADINLNSRQWEATAIVVEGLAMPRRIAKWLAAGSISQAYADEMSRVAASYNNGSLYMAPFVVKRPGTVFVPHVFAAVEMNHDRIADGLLMVHGEMMPLTFATTYAGGKPMAGAAVGQARFDAVRTGYSPDWATCWPEAFA